MLARDGNTPYPQALALPVSECMAVFETKAWAQYGKTQEAQRKYAEAMAARVNGVIFAISNLGKALAGR